MRLTPLFYVLALTIVPLSGYARGAAVHNKKIVSEAPTEQDALWKTCQADPGLRVLGDCMAAETAAKVSTSSFSPTATPTTAPPAK